MAAAGLEDSSLEDFELEEEGRQGQKKHFKNLDKKSKKEKGTKVIAEPLCIDVPIEVCHDEPIQQCRDVPRKHCTKTEKVRFKKFVYQFQNEKNSFLFQCTNLPHNFKKINFY